MGKNRKAKWKNKNKISHVLVSDVACGKKKKRIVRMTNHKHSPNQSSRKHSSPSHWQSQSH